MKKLLAAILFFGSVGTAMAQWTPNSAGYYSVMTEGWRMPTQNCHMEPGTPRPVTTCVTRPSVSCGDISPIYNTKTKRYYCPRPGCGAREGGTVCRAINYPPQCTTTMTPGPMRQVCTPVRPPAQNPYCGSINGQIKELRVLLESLDQDSPRYAAIREKIDALTQELKRLGCVGSPVGLRCCSSVASPNDPPCEDCGYRCLSSLTRIATPLGEVGVADLKVGDIVWSADASGNRIVRPIVKVSSVPIAGRNIIHLVLADGRTLDVSGPHPTANGKLVSDLKIGDAYDGSVVKSAETKPYEGSATYDILPAGETGFYWANGILMGSTLK